MRTTVTLDPDVAALIRRRMSDRGLSFKTALNDAVREGLGGSARPGFRTATADLGSPTLNLDRALQLVAALEDDELVRRMQIGK